MGIGIQAISKGLQQGFEGAGIAKRKMDEDERLKVRDQRDADREKRDAEAFKGDQETRGLNRRLLTSQVETAESNAQAQRELDEEMKRINLARGSGQGDFGQYVDPSAAAPQQNGIAAPGAEQQPQQNNPFMVPGDKLYANRGGADALEHKLKGEALQRFFTRTGQHEKALAVPETMEKLREANFSRNLKTATSALMVGAPGAMGAFSKVYSQINDGYNIDPATGKFNEETGGWTGVSVVDGKGKQVRTMDIPKEMIVQIAGLSDPLQAAKYEIEQKQKNRELDLKDRATRADERRADASMVSAGANASVAATNAQTRRDNAEQNADLRRQNELRSHFQVTAPFQIKTPDEVKALLPDEKKAYADARTRWEANNSRFNVASSIASMNPDLKVGDRKSVV